MSAPLLEVSDLRTWIETGDATVRCGPGTYTLTVSAFGYETPAARTFTLDEDQTYEAGYTMVPSAQSVLTGRIVSADDAMATAPLPGGAEAPTVQGGAAIDVEETRLQIEDIRRQIRRLGPINEEAPEDFEESRERYEKMLTALSWKRPIFEVSFQGTASGRSASIEMARSVRGEWRRAVLARCQAHGASIEWLV